MAISIMSLERHIPTGVIPAGPGLESMKHQSMVLTANSVDSSPIRETSPNITLELENHPSSEILKKRSTTIFSHQENNSLRNPTYKASFTKDLAINLAGCGIDIQYVNPVPIGEGANHLVYRYELPEAQVQVLKLAKPGSITTMTDGHEEEDANYQLAKRYFGHFVPETKVVKNPDNPKFYCITQKSVKGESLNNYRYRNDTSLQQQFREIIAMNNRLYAERKATLDFVGMPGFFSWFKRQFRKFFLRKSEFQISNILVDVNNKLQIIDFEFFDFGKSVGLLKRFKSFVGLSINRILVKHYFHLDIKRSKDKQQHPKTVPDPGSYHIVSDEQARTDAERYQRQLIKEESTVATISDDFVQQYQIFQASEEFQKRKAAKAGIPMDIIEYGSGANISINKGFNEIGNNLWYVDIDKEKIAQIKRAGLGNNNFPIHASAYDFYLPDRRKADVIIMRNPSPSDQGELRMLPLVPHLDEGGLVIVSAWASQADAIALAQQNNFRLVGYFTQKNAGINNPWQIEKSNLDFIKADLLKDPKKVVSGHSFDKYSSTTFIFQKLPNSS